MDGEHQKRRVGGQSQRAIAELTMLTPQDESQRKKEAERRKEVRSAH